MSANPRTLLFIVGNCGSGKTHYIYNDPYCRTLRVDGAIVLDDLNSREELLRAIMTGNHIIVADPWLCVESLFKKFLDFLEEHGVWGMFKVEGVFFESGLNALSACLDNCERREKMTGKRVSADFIYYLSSEYTPERLISIASLYSVNRHEKTTELIPVYRLDNSVLAYYSK